jgi:hypothetical protein
VKQRKKGGKGLANGLALTHKLIKLLLKNHVS